MAAEGHDGTVNKPVVLLEHVSNRLWVECRRGLGRQTWESTFDKIEGYSC